MTIAPIAPLLRSNYAFRALTNAHVPQIMQLQSDVYDALAEKNAILLRGEANFVEVTQAPHLAIGIFHGAEDTVLAGMAVARMSPDVENPSAEVQSVYVSPYHRIQGGLMLPLLTELEQAVSLADKAMRLHCRVAEGNHSARKFQDGGYVYVGHTHRPAEVDPDGTKVELFEKWLPPLNISLDAFPASSHETSDLSLRTTRQSLPTARPR